ncbi:hypothetical protein ACJX0J_026766, partial [Zea mays]
MRMLLITMLFSLCSLLYRTNSLCDLSAETCFFFHLWTKALATVITRGQKGKILALFTRTKRTTFLVRGRCSDESSSTRVKGHGISSLWRTRILYDAITFLAGRQGHTNGYMQPFLCNYYLTSALSLACAL